MGSKVETFTPAGVMKPIGPYSHVAKGGGLITISATAGVDPETGQVAGGDIESQTVRIIESFKAMLESVNSDLDHVLHVSVYLTDISNFAPMNAAYERAMGDRRPARTAVAVAALPKPGALLTMSAIAVERS